MRMGKKKKHKRSDVQDLRQEHGMAMRSNWT